MAICLAIERWRCYLLGRHFVVRTNQQSLKHIMEQREVGGDYQKWVRKLIGFDFEIQYKPGAHNRVADALSRRGTDTVQLSALVTTQGVEWEELEKELAGDVNLKKLRQEVEQGEVSHPGFSVIHGKLTYKGRIVLPKKSPFIAFLLREGHDSPAGENKEILRLI